MSQLKSAKDDREKLGNDLFAAQQEKERLAEQVKNLEQSRAVSPSQGADVTHKLLEESVEKIRTLETEREKLKEENEELQKMSTLKEERAKAVLKTARAKIQKCEDEKKKLELELEQIGKSSSCKEYLNICRLVTLFVCCLRYFCFLQAKQTLLVVLRSRMSD